MFRMTWIVALTVLFAGCTDQAGSEEESPTAAGGGPGPTDGFDAENFTKMTEGVYEFEDLLVGASPGSGQFEDHYETLLPARQDTFQVGEHVSNLAFSAEMACGTGSGRIVVHDPEGERVYASHGWNLVGAPLVACLVVEEQNEEKGTGFVPGEYAVTYYVAGAMALGMEVKATYLVPNEADAA